MPLAQSERVRPDRVETLTQLFAEAPPMPCPCLVLAYSPTTEEFAVAPINLIGHPTAPVVDPGGADLVEVEVAVHRAGAGLLDRARSALGGRTTYEVTVSVRNVSTGPLTAIQLQGSAEHRFDDDAAILDLEDPPALEPGQTFEQTVEAELHPPSGGNYQWTVVASGAGSAVTASATSGHVPLLLYLVLAVLLIDLLVIWRRMRTRRRGGHDDEVDDLDEPAEPETWEEIQARWAAEEPASVPTG
jgi:hypothetical protein